MNVSRIVGLSSRVGLLGLLMMVCLGAEYLHRGGLPWQFLNLAQAEVFATFQAADVQWLIVICISVYLCGFIWLHRSWNREVNLTASLKTRPVAGPGLQHAAISAGFCRPRALTRRVAGVLKQVLRQDASLVVGIVLYAIGALAYAFSYDQASKSTDTLLLCFGITLSFCFRCWRAVEAKRNRPFNHAGVVIGITLILLCIGAVWRPEAFYSYQYRGQARWSGLWDNPNTFGMLMGIGLVLAVGHVTLSLKSVVQSLRSGSDHRTSNGKAWRWLKIVLLLTAAGLCGLGLVKSYSRGAWLGTACGLAYLTYQVVRCQVSCEGEAWSTAFKGPAGNARNLPAQDRLKAGHRMISCGLCIEWFRKNWLLASVILISVLLLGFWNYRHTENVVARRAMSASQANDFSWRNRVAAWVGSLQMMAEKPLLGLGWNRPEQVYDKFDRAPKVPEGAAIQLNDYFTLGTTLGIPALVCFVAFTGLSLCPRPKVQSQKSAACGVLEAGEGRGARA